MNFIIYDKNGKILRTGSCPEIMMNIQAEENEFIMEGEADDASQYILNGKIVEFSFEMMEEKIKVEEDTRIKENREGLIKKKMDEIVRKQAIFELEKEGIL